MTNIRELNMKELELVYGGTDSQPETQNIAPPVAWVISPIPTVSGRPNPGDGPQFIPGGEIHHPGDGPLF